MSTSLLYHAFGMIDYDYKKSEYHAGKITFHVEAKGRAFRCPQCGNWKVSPKGTVERTFNTIPIGLKPVQIVVPVPRVFCDLCDIVRQVKLSFAGPKKRYTKKFERYVLDLSKYMTIKDVAAHTNVSWDVIKDIQKRYLSKTFGKPKLKKLKQIAIDEIAIKKGHKYITLVLDLRSGAVVFVGDGKGKDALDPFWKRLKSSKAKIEAVATDMSRAYIEAVRKNLPDTVLVFDHFHVVKLFNEKLTKLRTKLHKELDNPDEREILKGTRWLLLKNPENLDPSRNELERLEKALEINKPLATAYYMKEDLRQIWNQPNKDEAEKFLWDWADRALVSGISMLEKFAETLLNHRLGILAYYDYPISTGPLEGTNNKIKTMKRQAYGFRDHEFFKLKIKAAHLTKYALVG